jgi:hypothetical protein
MFREREREEDMKTFKMKKKQSKNFYVNIKL